MFCGLPYHVQLSVSKDVGDSDIRGMNSTRSLPRCNDDWPAARRTAFHCSDFAHGRASHRVHVQSWLSVPHGAVG